MAHAAAHSARSSARPRRAHYEVDATITPESGFKVSLLQGGGILVGIFLMGSGYAYLVNGMSSTRADVVDIKTTQAVAITQTQAAIKEQDERRSQLGKQFIDSNEKIAAAVSTLATQMAVQQERQKSTDEKLEKVLTQIGMALAPVGVPLPPTAPRR